MVISPTVAREAQAQFGCESVPGAALENEGGRGSALAHWEYKWFQVRHFHMLLTCYYLPVVTHAMIHGEFDCCHAMLCLWLR